MSNEIVALLSDVVCHISHVSSGAMQIVHVSSGAMQIVHVSSCAMQIVHVNRVKKCHVQPGRLQMVLEEDKSDDQDDGLPQPSEHSGYVPEVTDRMYGDEEDDAAGRERNGRLEVPTGMNPVPAAGPVPVQVPLPGPPPGPAGVPPIVPPGIQSVAPAGVPLIPPPPVLTTRSGPASEATDVLRKTTMEVSRSLAVW